MSRFKPEDNEKIILEGRATYKKGVGVIPGYAFLTSARFVFCGSRGALSGVLSGTPYNDRILFSIPVGDMASVQEGRYGLTKTAIIAGNGGEKHALIFDPHDSWFSMLRDPAALMNATVSLPANETGDDGPVWYYEDNGRKVGPVPFSKMKGFVISNHTVYRFTKVWREEMPEWRKAEETELAEYFDGPPPLTGDGVSNTIVWILAFAPIIGVNIEKFIGGFLGDPNFDRFSFITIALNILLSLFDERKLVAAGHNTRVLGLGASWLVPVYLFKRAKALKQNLAYFIVWLVTFGLVLLFA